MKVDKFSNVSKKNDDLVLLEENLDYGVLPDIIGKRELFLINRLKELYSHKFSTEHAHGISLNIAGNFIFEYISA